MNCIIENLKLRDDTRAHEKGKLTEYQEGKGPSRSKAPLFNTKAPTKGYDWIGIRVVYKEMHH